MRKAPVPQAPPTAVPFPSQPERKRPPRENSALKDTAPKQQPYFFCLEGGGVPAPLSKAQGA